MTNITDNFTKNENDESHFLSLGLDNSTFHEVPTSINSSNLFAFRTNDLARIFSTGDGNPDPNTKNIYNYSKPDPNSMVNFHTIHLLR